MCDENAVKRDRVVNNCLRMRPLYGSIHTHTYTFALHSSNVSPHWQRACETVVTIALLVILSTSCSFGRWLTRLTSLHSYVASTVGFCVNHRNRIIKLARQLRVSMFIDSHRIDQIRSRLLNKPFGYSPPNGVPIGHYLGVLHNKKKKWNVEDITCLNSSESCLAEDSAHIPIRIDLSASGYTYPNGLLKPRGLAS